MTDPPLAGAIQLSVTLPFPAIAVTFVGAEGSCAGVTDADAAEAGPLPEEFVAMTVNA